jgi:hypothetical protein
MSSDATDVGSRLRRGGPSSGEAGYGLPSLFELWHGKKEDADFGEIGGVAGGVGGGEGEIEDVGINENHGSRVRARSASHDILGVKAADAKRASISPGVGFGFGAGRTLANS